MKSLKLFIYWQVIVLTSALVAGEPQEQLKLRLTWGHRSKDTTAFYVKFLAEGIEIAGISGRDLEPISTCKKNGCKSRIPTRYITPL